MLHCLACQHVHIDEAVRQLGFICTKVFDHSSNVVIKRVLGRTDDCDDDREQTMSALHWSIASVMGCLATAQACLADPTAPLFSHFPRDECQEQEDGRWAAPVTGLYASVVAAQPILGRIDISQAEGQAQLAQAMVNANFCPNPNGCSAETKALWAVKFAFWSLADNAPDAPYALERVDGRALSYHGGVRALIRDSLVNDPDGYQIICRPAAFDLPIPAPALLPGGDASTESGPGGGPGGGPVYEPVHGPLAGPAKGLGTGPEENAPEDGSQPASDPASEPGPPIASEPAAPTQGEPTQGEPKQGDSTTNQGERPDEEDTSNAPSNSLLSALLPDWFAIAGNSGDLVRPYRQRSFARISYNANEINNRRVLDVQLAASLPLAKVWTTTKGEQSDDPTKHRQIKNIVLSFIEYKKRADNDANPYNETNNLSAGLAMSRAVESRASACSNPLAPKRERYARWRSESELKWITDDEFESSQGLVSVSGVYEPCLPSHWNTDPVGWVSDHTPLNLGRFNWSAELAATLDASEVIRPGEKFRLLDVEDFQRWGGSIRWRARWTLPNKTALTADTSYLRRVGFNTEVADVDLVKASLDFAPQPHSRVKFGIDYTKGDNVISLQNQNIWRLSIGVRN